VTFTFKDKYENANPNAALIVDALNLAFRWKHTAKFRNYAEDFKNTVLSIAKSYGCVKIIICADWGKSAYRKAIFPEYKADRAERFKDQTEEEKQQFQDFFEEYENTLKLLSETMTVLRFKGVEADDLAAHLVKNREQYELEDIWLLSSDGDWDLLVTEGASRFCWRTRKEINLQNWSDHYKVTPEEFISYKCLIGDKSDNIPGVNGVGPVRAANLIEKHGSAFDIRDAIPFDGKAKYIQNLNESGDQILVNYELMDLLTHCDEAIGTENVKEIRTAMGDVAW
jgi:DNA polymerase-1